MGGLALTGKRGLDQAVFSSWGGCSWWGVVFVLGVDVGVVVGWCVVTFVGGGVGGVLHLHTPIHIQRPHTRSTSTSHTIQVGWAVSHTADLGGLNRYICLVLIRTFGHVGVVTPTIISYLS